MKQRWVEATFSHASAPPAPDLLQEGLEITPQLCGQTSTPTSVPRWGEYFTYTTSSLPLRQFVFKGEEKVQLHTTQEAALYLDHIPNCDRPTT